MTNKSLFDIMASFIYLFFLFITSELWTDKDDWYYYDKGACFPERAFENAVFRVSLLTLH